MRGQSPISSLKSLSSICVICEICGFSFLTFQSIVPEGNTDMKKALFILIILALLLGLSILF